MRIKIVTENRPYCYKQIEPFYNYHLKSYGIEIVNNHEDLLLCQNLCLTEEMIKEKDVIILERADSGTLTQANVRQWLAHPHVKKCLKSTLSPFSCQNLNMKYLYYLYGEDLDPVPFVPVAKKDFDKKVTCLIPLALQKRFETFYELIIDFDGVRDLDFNYVASICSFPPHRNKVVETLTNIKNNNNIIKDQLIEGDTLSISQTWIDLLKRSKITVSPWGHGEMTYRDFDAIYCGSLLLKADSQHIISYPDIYQENVIHFDHKCCDLEDKLQEILAHWDDYRDFRIKARQKLVDFWDWEARTNDFIKMLRSCYETN